MAHANTLPDYISKDEIRAVLGVSKTELTDATLGLTIYPIVVEMALDDIHENLSTDYATVAALPSPTATQHRFIDAVKMYALYALAKHLLSSLPMFSVKSLSDGRADFQRIDTAFADTAAGVDATFNSLRFRLTAVYKQLYPAYELTTSSTLTFLSASTLGVDPVTGA